MQSAYPKQVTLVVVLLMTLAYSASAFGYNKEVFVFQHGTACRADANDTASEQSGVNYDEYGLVNDYSYYKFAFCPVQTTEFAEYTHFSIDGTALTLGGCSIKLANYNTSNAFYARVCYLKTNGTSYPDMSCAGWYSTSASGPNQFNMAVPTSAVAVHTAVAIQAYVPGKQAGGSASRIYSYSCSAYY